MKTYLLLIIIIIIGSFTEAICQRRVIVPEGFGTLNELLRKDTLAGGIRKDPKTVYVLRRGGVYILSGTILTSGFDLQIEAEEGNGPRPYVLMGFLEGATQVEECFEVRGNVSFRSLHLTAINEFNTFISRILSASSPNLRLSFTDCVIDGSGQTFVRINSSGSKIYMLNNTVSRMGRPSNPDNGRVIDDRGNEIDSIVVENNTWYNITSRVIRDGGGEIKYAKFNQNTFVNVGQRLAAIGPVDHFIFTNNIIVNPRFLGNTSTSLLVSLEFSGAGASPITELTNNNVYYDSDVLGAWQTIRNEGLSRLEPPFVIAGNEAFVLNRTNEPLVFKTKPVSPTVFILESQLRNSSSIPDWDWSGAVAGKPWEITNFAYHDFSYPTTTASFTGSTKNEPLGDLRWFAQYEVAGTIIDLAKQARALINREINNPVIGGNNVALSNLQAAIAAASGIAANPLATGIQLGSARNTLRQAMDAFRASLIITDASKESAIALFPNPVINSVRIEFLTSQADIKIIALDGRTVLHQVSQSNAVELDLTALPAGLYLALIKTDTGISTHKITKL
jgi:hypothetical protein